MASTFALQVAVLGLFWMHCSAWWCSGHMLVGEIAKQIMEPQVYALYNDAEELMFSQFPKAKTITEGACWPDDLKQDGVHHMDSWHFEDIYIYHNTTPVAPIPGTERNNVTFAIDQCNKTLHASQANTWEVGFALYLAVHFIGDVHQPLHCAAEVTERAPKGDQGGNGVSVHVTKSINNLHKLWDSMGNQFETPKGKDLWKRPLDESNYNDLKVAAKELLTKYKVHCLAAFAENKTAHSWAMESFSYARDYVYVNLTSEPDEAYISKTKEISNMRAVIGGMRLAEMLTSAAPFRKGKGKAPKGWKPQAKKPRASAPHAASTPVSSPVKASAPAPVKGEDPKVQPASDPVAAPAKASAPAPVKGDDRKMEPQGVLAPPTNPPFSGVQMSYPVFGLLVTVTLLSIASAVIITVRLTRLRGRSDYEMKTRYPENTVVEPAAGSGDADDVALVRKT